MLLHGDLCSTGEVTVWFWTRDSDLIVVDPEMGLDIGHRLSSIVTELTTEWLLRGVAILDVAGQSGGGGAGHVALRALVVVDVGPHVVAQQPLQGKLLATIVAFKGVLFGHLLALAVIQELDPVREESATVGTPDHLLLGVGPHVLLQLGHGARPAAAVAPSAPHL